MHPPKIPTQDGTLGGPQQVRHREARVKPGYSLLLCRAIFLDYTKED